MIDIDTPAQRTDLMMIGSQVRRRTRLHSNNRFLRVWMPCCTDQDASIDLDRPSDTGNPILCNACNRLYAPHLEAAPGTQSGYYVVWTLLIPMGKIQQTSRGGIRQPMSDDDC